MTIGNLDLVVFKIIKFLEMAFSQNFNVLSQLRKYSPRSLKKGKASITPLGNRKHSYRGRPQPCPQIPVLLRTGIAPRRLPVWKSSQHSTDPLTHSNVYGLPIFLKWEFWNKTHSFKNKWYSTAFPEQSMYCSITQYTNPP